MQDARLINAFETPAAGKSCNFRTDFSAREAYEMQDASTGQRPNVGAVCVSIVLHSPTKRTVKTYVKEVVSEEDANGYARWVVEVSKGEVTEEEKVALTTDVYFGYARNKGDGRFHHTFHQDILRLLKTGKARTSTQSAHPAAPLPSLTACCAQQVKHAFAAWHDGKVLPGCKNYAKEPGEKWATFEARLPELEHAFGFMDGAIVQYQNREAIHGTCRSFADIGVRMTHDIHEKHDFKGPWDNYGKESTDSRRKDVVSGAATINNAYAHAKHNAIRMSKPVDKVSGEGEHLVGRRRELALPPHPPLSAGEERRALARLLGRQVLPLVLPLRRGRGREAPRRHPPRRRHARARRRQGARLDGVQALRGRHDDGGGRLQQRLLVRPLAPGLLLLAAAGGVLQPRRLEPP